MLIFLGQINIWKLQEKRLLHAQLMYIFLLIFLKKSYFLLIAFVLHVISRPVVPLVPCNNGYWYWQFLTFWAQQCVKAIDRDRVELSRKYFVSRNSNRLSDKTSVPYVLKAMKILSIIYFWCSCVLVWFTNLFTGDFVFRLQTTYDHYLYGDFCNQVVIFNSLRPLIFIFLTIL